MTSLKNHHSYNQQQDRKEAAEVQPSYIHKRFIKQVEQENLYVQRKADAVELEEKVKDFQAWVVTFVMIVVCIAGLILYVELANV